MIDFTVAYDKLAGFQTAEEIRSFFQHEGITGLAYLSNSCPIANWMTRTTGKRCGAFSKIFMHGENGREPTEIANATDAMFSFILEFDSGSYPELEHAYIQESY